MVLLHSSPLSGTANMSLDEALLRDVERRGDGTAYLRLYRWDPPCLSFGRNEPALTRYDRDLIERLGLDVVRRPTGGRAVWHEHELTYAVAAPISAFGCLQDSYRDIHRRLAMALQRLGARAELAPRATRTAGLSAGACFAQPMGGEVVIGGRKVIGSAQVRQGNAFLQHGSILLDGSQDMVARVSRVPRAPPNATTLRAALGHPVTFHEVAQAILATWGPHAILDPRAGRLAGPSGRRADPSWTWRR
ncbi:MAG TPA: lipoate--protein ligase family protein [Gemmatimonadales bacterium]